MFLIDKNLHTWFDFVVRNVLIKPWPPFAKPMSSKKALSGGLQHTMLTFNPQSPFIERRASRKLGQQVTQHTKLKTETQVTTGKDATPRANQ